MKVLFVIDEDDVPSYQHERFIKELQVPPRHGENVVRHVDGQSSQKGRFTVEKVTWVFEERNWYLDHPEMLHDVVVTLKMEKW